MYRINVHSYYCLHLLYKAIATIKDSKTPELIHCQGNTKEQAKAKGGKSSSPPSLKEILTWKCVLKACKTYNTLELQKQEDK